MKHKSRLLFLVMAFLLLSPAALADRGRPTVSGGTFVADNGQLLRGFQWAMNIAGGNPPPGCVLNAPSCALVDNIKNYGANALHLYAEMPGVTPGAYAATVDQMVTWTGNAGLYLVITIGGPGCDPSYTNAFWQFYAPRYANRTHVIYEIRNEPDGTIDPPSTDCAINLNKNAYNLIRTLAPSTAVLLMSYPLFEDKPGLLVDIDKLTNAGVNWSNAAIAFHGYQWACLPHLDCDRPEDTTWPTIDYVRANRPTVPLINTEFYVLVSTSTSPWYIKQAKTQGYEDRHISWLSFMPIDDIHDYNVKSPIDEEELVWNNEWGLPWPAVNTPPVNSTITLRSLNGYYASVNATTGKVYANGTAVGAAQKFTVKRPATGGDSICLQSALNGRFVNANATNQYKLETQVTFCNNGRFEWMKKPNGAVVLRAQNNQQVVDANVLADSQLIAARRDSVWGEFTNFTVTIVP